MSYGRPISLNESLGALRDDFQASVGDPKIEDDKRRFIQRLGFRLLREVNAVAVAGATSVVQLEENLGALEVNLSDEVLSRLDEISRPFV